METKNLTPAEAAGYLTEKFGLRLATTTLAKWRCIKSDGPAFRRFGRRILYAAADLDDFANRVLSGRLTSTSDMGGPL